ncbi:hypothetical protein PHAVU_008G136600 [Phaseolus vulgaris]|uniref:Uncharacterized protein n=2 Tax=Phaseolus vulgaris TaxID=3885 RepID=V7B8D2_PHAVU|nr:hypothetical protein PHAVU_008G136600g [Phaseolus vulgaris]ESW12721.1 hypothetical protein PHAVU_008G136600g [Phaseolus vulgaris]
MLSLAHPFFLLLLALLSPTASLTHRTNATTIYEVLRDYGLPMGLFPKGIKDFGLAHDGSFWVHLDKACNAKFENELHYERNVSGHISCGMIDALSGLQAQDLFLWLEVMSIRVDVPPTGLICFDVGAANKSFPLSLFETPPECVAVSSKQHHTPSQGQGQSGRLRYKLDEGTSGRDVL